MPTHGMHQGGNLWVIAGLHNKAIRRGCRRLPTLERQHQHTVWRKVYVLCRPRAERTETIDRLHLRYLGLIRFVDEQEAHRLPRIILGDIDANRVMLYRERYKIFL